MDLEASLAQYMVDSWDLEALVEFSRDKLESMYKSDPRTLEADLEYIRDQLQEEWVEALLSGEYEQTQHALHNDEGFCCLGVGCETVLEFGIDVPVSFREDVRHYLYDDNSNLLPQSVQMLLGLRTIDGEFIIDSEEILKIIETVDVYPNIGDQAQLANLNDLGLCFEDIARIIQLRPKGLFVDEEMGFSFLS